MTNIISGQSIAAAADTVDKNGKVNSTFGTVLIVAGSLIAVGGCSCICYYLKKKRDNNSHNNNMRRDKAKHEQRIVEIRDKANAQERIVRLRSQLSHRKIGFDSDLESSPDSADISVQTYEEVIAGTPVNSRDLRLGLRCFHIGEDCGLIGRTNVGKTSWVWHYAISIARGYQEDGAILSPGWLLKQPMKVLYFAFEQKQNDIKVNYGNNIKSIPNFYLELNTNPGDYRAIRLKIQKIQQEIGNYRLLVVFDNITKMKYAQGKDKQSFFQWLENYRVESSAKGTPITYLKVFHTQGSYKDYMPIGSTCNYGCKTDTYFTQDLVAFGMCKEGDGRLRYLKELKNKLEPDGEKQTLSIYRFARTKAPLYDYLSEAKECDILPSKKELVRGSNIATGESNIDLTLSGKRGRPIQKNISDDEYLYLYDMVKSKEFTSREVEDVYHVSWKWVKKKVRQIQQRTQDIA